MVKNRDVKDYINNKDSTIYNDINNRTAEIAQTMQNNTNELSKFLIDNKTTLQNDINILKSDYNKIEEEFVRNRDLILSRIEDKNKMIKRITLLFSEMRTKSYDENYHKVLRNVSQSAQDTCCFGNLGNLLYSRLL